jgi:hypothetical protein
MNDEQSPYRLRVEKGSPSGEELAALTVVLLEPDLPRHRRTAARWRRPERGPGFESPRAWRNGIR